MADERPVGGVPADSAEALFRASPIPTIVHDPQTGAVLDANDACEDLFGYDRDTLVDMNVAEFSAVEDAASEAKAAFEATNREGAFELDWEIERPDATQTEVHVQLRQATLDGSDVVLAYVTDVSTNRKRERVLDGLHNVATSLLDAETASEVADITTKAAEEILESSLASVRLREGDRLEIAALTAESEARLGDDLPAYEVGEGAIGEAYASGEARVFERIPTDIGLPHTENVRSAIFVPLADHGIFTLAADVPEHFDERDLEIATLLTRLSTAALDQIERRDRLGERSSQLETLLNNAPIMFYEMDPDGTLTESRGRGLEALGLEPGEAVGLNAYDLYGGFGDVSSTLDRALDGERVSATIQLGDLYLENTFQPVLTDGEVTSVIGVAFDVTDLKSLEQQFAELSESSIQLAETTSFECAIEEAMDIVADVLEESVSAYWEADWEAGQLASHTVSDGANLLGAEGEALVHEVGDPVWNVFEAGETVVDNHFDADDAAGAAPLRSVVLAPVGEHGLLSVGSAERNAFDDRSRDLLSILAGMLRTTLDRLAYEQELEAKRAELEQSNEDLQQFAYVASHDLQEPLRMISSYISLLDEEYADRFDDEAEEYMHYAVDGAHRMQAMINALLQYSRVHSRAEDPTPVDVSAVLQETLKGLEVLLEERDGASVEYGDIPPVMADESQLGQLMQNLIKNAIHHGGESPTITVDGRLEDDSVHLTVADDGPGIAADQQERIFQIFKGDSGREGSTGIGLAVCRRIASRHGGDIWVESAEGEGATFHVTLPAAQPAGRVEA